MRGLPSRNVGEVHNTHTLAADCCSTQHVPRQRMAAAQAPPGHHPALAISAAMRMQKHGAASGPFRDHKATVIPAASRWPATSFADMPALHCAGATRTLGWQRILPFAPNMPLGLLVFVGMDAGLTIQLWACQGPRQAPPVSYLPIVCCVCTERTKAAQQQLVRLPQAACPLQSPPEPVLPCQGHSPCACARPWQLPLLQRRAPPTPGVGYWPAAVVAGPWHSAEGNSNEAAAPAAGALSLLTAFVLMLRDLQQGTVWAQHNDVVELTRPQYQVQRRTVREAKHTPQHHCRLLQRSACASGWAAQHISSPGVPPPCSRCAAR